MIPKIIKRLASQTVVYGLSSVIGRLLNYLLVFIYTRVFLPQEYGAVTELYSYTGFLIVIFTYGMETAFFRYVKEESRSAEVVYSTSLISLFISTIILASTIALLSPFLAEQLHYVGHEEYFVWIALILGFDALSSIPFAGLRYKEKPFKFAAIKFVNIGLNIGLVLFFLLFCPAYVDSFPILNSVYSPDVGIGYIFISNLIASGITLLLLLTELVSIKWVFDIQLWKRMVLYASPLILVGFAGSINELLDRVLLKFLLPFDETTNMHHLGIYGACYKLSILMTLFTQAYRFAAEPFFFAQSTKDNAQEVYAITMKYFIFVGALIFIGVVYFIDLFKWLIDESYHEGLVVVPILLFANLCLGVYYNLSIWYKLTNKTLLGAYIAIAGALFTLFFNIILIPIMGYVGSAWTTLFCYLFMVIASYLIGQKHYSIPYPIKDICFTLLFAIALVLIDWFLISELALTIAYAVRICGIAGFVYYIYKKELKTSKDVIF